MVLKKSSTLVVVICGLFRIGNIKAIIYIFDLNNLVRYNKEKKC